MIRPRYIVVVTDSADESSAHGVYVDSNLANRVADIWQRQLDEKAKADNSSAPRVWVMPLSGKTAAERKRFWGA